MKVHPNCCGLDVHKKMIAACLIWEDAEGSSVTEKRLFGSMTRELHELAQWLCAAQVTAVAMEATGVYWMPVWNVLEAYGLQLLLINPEHYKAVRRKKTDLKDGTRIAELLQDGPECEINCRKVPCRASYKFVFSAVTLDGALSCGWKMKFTHPNGLSGTGFCRSTTTAPSMARSLSPIPSLSAPALWRNFQLQTQLGSSPALAQL
jgi:hypothetical protein